jgi:hypothetical protein
LVSGAVAHSLRESVIAAVYAIHIWSAGEGDLEFCEVNVIGNRASGGWLIGGIIGLFSRCVFANNSAGTLINCERAQIIDCQTDRPRAEFLGHSIARGEFDARDIRTVKVNVRPPPSLSVPRARLLFDDGPPDVQRADITPEDDDQWYAENRYFRPHEGPGRVVRTIIRRSDTDEEVEQVTVVRDEEVEAPSRNWRPAPVRASKGFPTLRRRKSPARGDETRIDARSKNSD